MTLLKAIRAKCMECTGGNRRKILHCPSDGCPLYPYRMWRKPSKSSHAVALSRYQTTRKAP